MLWDQLELEIRVKHWDLLSKNIVMLHDNAHLHTAPDTVETFHQLNLRCEVCSLDMALSDCYLFGSLKDALRGHHFASYKEVKKQHMRGLSPNQTHFLSECLWTAGLSVLKKMGLYRKKCYCMHANCNCIIE
jgi:hypothetical protein